MKYEFSMQGDYKHLVLLSKKNYTIFGMHFSNHSQVDLYLVLMENLDFEKFNANMALLHAL